MLLCVVCCSGPHYIMLIFRFFASPPRGFVRGSALFIAEGSRVGPTVSYRQTIIIVMMPTHNNIVTTTTTIIPGTYSPCPWEPATCMMMMSKKLKINGGGEMCSSSTMMCCELWDACCVCCVRKLRRVYLEMFSLAPRASIISSLVSRIDSLAASPLISRFWGVPSGFFPLRYLKNETKILFLGSFGGFCGSKW